MAALGRILQFAGWIWVGVGFLGPVVGLPFDVNFFPGLILVFISRIFRSRGTHRMPEGVGEAESEPDRPEPRMLNTEREHRPESSTPAPGSQRAKPEPIGPIFGPKDTEVTESRDALLEKIVLAGASVVDDAAADESKIPDIVTKKDGDRPMTSAEMIASAHEKWDKKKDARRDTGSKRE